MRNNFTWCILLILPCVLVTSRPMRDELEVNRRDTTPMYDYNAQNMPKQEDVNPPDPQVISVRITSSVAVGRGRGKLSKILENKHAAAQYDTNTNTPIMETSTLSTVTEKKPDTNVNLEGANIEFIKQLNSKKEARGLHYLEKVHNYPADIRAEYLNETNDSVAESSLTSTVLEISSPADESEENVENVPLARSVPRSPSSQNYIQGLTNKPPSERGNYPRLTTVSFNIVHDMPKATNHYNEPSDTYKSEGTKKIHSEPAKLYNETPKVYSQPAQVYSEPAKYYSEPAKVYSEPAKVYSEPAKIYSEPAKIYSEPAKYYSQPASLHLPRVPTNYTPWQPRSQDTASSTIVTTPITTITNPVIPGSSRPVEHQPESNYEVDEKVSVLSDGRSHGVQETTTESCKQENCKVGYVVEGRQFRKYRVEERTSDGFIVGEYGVVRNEDGALRGVRYTADGDASPRLIYDALMKFLQL